MKKKNILLVEDDAIIGMYEKSLLEQEGYNVIYCNSGEKAIEYNNSTNFDLILMDIDLGKGINGVEAAEVILKTKHIPIVFISSHNEKEIIEQTERINSYGYIVKNSPERVIFTVIKMAFKLFESNKRIEDSFRETRKKEILLESIINSIPDYIGILTPDFKILKSNRDFYEFLGINKEDISGDHYSDLFNKPKKDQKDSFFQEFIKTKGIYRQEIYKENINKYFDVMLYPIVEEDGSIINFVEHIRDITIEKNNRDRLDSLLKEKDIILKEVHHRIKNNMNIILTLLKMQQEQYDDEIIKNILNDASSRIKSMMILYDTLYSSKSKKEISSYNYLSSLIDGVIEIFPKDIDLKIEKNIDDFLISDKILSIIGIILNEFLTNSMKYAFLNKKEGLIVFNFSKSNGNIVMIFKDNGIGIKDNFDFEKSDGFGIKLINMLVNQLNGTISLNKNNGVEYIIKFTI